MRGVFPLFLAMLFAIPAGVEAQEAEAAAKALYDKGRERYDDKEWTEAETLFRTSLSMFPTPYARIYRAATLAKLERCEEARSEIDAVNLDDVAEGVRDKARLMMVEAVVSCRELTARLARPAPEPPVTIAPASDGVEDRETSAGETILVVSPDGSGDYLSLVDALSEAPDGAVIRLRGALHRLSRSVTVSRSLTLGGEGMDQTMVVGDAEGFVLRFTGPGTLRMHDLSIEHQGANWARVLVVTGGELDARAIRVRGAIRNPSLAEGGEGIWIDGNARATIVAAEVSGNALHGIKVTGEGLLMIEGSRLTANARSGVVFFGKSSGLMRGNRCDGNGEYGIGLVDKADVRLSGNTCDANRRGGLYAETQTILATDGDRCERFVVR